MSLYCLFEGHRLTVSMFRAKSDAVPDQSLQCLLTERSICLFVLFDLILYVPSTIFQLNRDGSSWAEPVLS